MSNPELTYYIELQSSRSSTADIFIVTVNTGITSTLITKLDDISLSAEHQRHYTRRIGAYLDDTQDK